MESGTSADPFSRLGRFTAGAHVTNVTKKGGGLVVRGRAADNGTVRRDRLGPWDVTPGLRSRPHHEVRVLIAMAGLPGTGKSTLATRLADALGGVVLSKDVVRAALFPARVIDYSAMQDAIAMSAVYSAAEYILAFQTTRLVFLDGRTFSKPGQLDAPLALAAELGVPFRVIECVCLDEVARARIGADRAAGAHLAGNRTPDLYDRVKAAAVPLVVPRLTLDTGALALDECVARATAYLSE